MIEGIERIQKTEKEVKKAERSAENRHYIDRTRIIARTLGEGEEEGAE